MVSVRPTVEDSEDEIDFGWGSNPNVSGSHVRRIRLKLITASFDLIFFQSVPKRSGVQAKQPRRPFLDPLAAFERFEEERFFD